MLKDQLQLLTKEINTLRQKIKTRLDSDKQTLSQKTNQLNETNRKLELTAKENAENEKVLETLLKEMRELEKELD